MKCPRCGRTNGKTNKFCRECGYKLEGLAEKEVGQVESGETRVDEVELGEELFAVLELFEAGDLDSALERGAKLSLANPGSASAHSLVALVCEKKAEQELAAGRDDLGRKYLKHAIERYEDIVDLNPDSAADREKLAALRAKYPGHEAPAEPAAVSTPVQEPVGFKAAFNSIPRPALVAAGAFLFILALSIIFYPSGKKSAAVVAANQDGSGKAQVSVTQSDDAPQSPALKVYTFPAAPSASMAPQVPIPHAASPAPAPRAAAQDIKPLRVPSIAPELTLVAEPKKSSGTLPQIPKVVVEPAKNPSPSQGSAAPSGTSLQAQAIRLHDQGRIQEAIGVANQAIVLYQAEIDAGRSVETARRGIANTNKLISVWQGSLGSQ